MMSKCIGTVGNGMHQAGSSRRIVAAAVAATVMAGGLSAPAASLTWDNNGTGANQTDGTGAWLGANLWYDSTVPANTNWVSGSDAVFGNGGAGAAVTLASPTAVGSLTFNGFTGTYTLGTSSQALTLNAGLTMNSNSGNLTFSSPVAVGGSQNWTNNSIKALALNAALSSAVSGTNTITLNGTGTGGTSFLAAIGDGAGKTAIVLDASNSVTSFNVANTYSGGTTLKSGTLKINGNTSLGAAGSVLNISGGTLGSGRANNAGQDLAAAYQINLSGDLTVGTSDNTGRILFGGATSGVGTGVDVKGDVRTITLYSGSSSIVATSAQVGIGSSGTSSDAITSTGGAGTLKIAGGSAASATAPGIFLFNGVLNFGSNVGFTIGSNATTVFNSVAGAGFGGAPVVTVESGGALNLSDNAAAASTASKSVTIGALAGAGRVTNAAALAGTATLTIAGAGDSEFSGSIQNGGFGNSLGAVALTVAKPSGAQTLSGTNTYTGPTRVTAGTLLVGKNGSGSIASPVTVTAGTFGGSGSSSAGVTVGDGAFTAGGHDAFLAPGNGNTGTFTTTSSLSLLSDATFDFELDSINGKADKLIANGVTIDPAALFAFADLGDGSGVTDGQSFLVIDNTSTEALLPFANLAEGGTVVSNGVTYTATYMGGVGSNDLVFTAAVPEPAVIGLIGIASAAMLGRRRKGVC